MGCMVCSHWTTPAIENKSTSYPVPMMAPLLLWQIFDLMYFFQTPFCRKHTWKLRPNAIHCYHQKLVEIRVGCDLSTLLADNQFNPRSLYSHYQLQDIVVLNPIYLPWSRQPRCYTPFSIMSMNYVTLQRYCHVSTVRHLLCSLSSCLQLPYCIP